MKNLAATLCLTVALLLGSAGVIWGQGTPDLSGLDYETQFTIKLACSSERGIGVATYAGCVREQLEELKSGPSTPDLSGLDRENQSKSADFQNHDPVYEVGGVIFILVLIFILLFGVVKTFRRQPIVAILCIIFLMPIYVIWAFCELFTRPIRK